MNKKFLILLIVPLLGSCLQEDELKKPFISYTPASLNDGWTMSSPENEGVDAQKLEKI